MKTGAACFRPVAFIHRSLARTRRLAAVAALVSSSVTWGAEPDSLAGDTFSSALAELKQQREQRGALLNVPEVTMLNETFLRRIDLAKLGPEEIAELVRLNVFGYGEIAPPLAKVAYEQLVPLAGQPDVRGALATVLCSILSPQANVPGPERQAWRTRALRHPGLEALLQSDFGDMALNTAMTAETGGGNLELILGLAARLDATKSTSAAMNAVFYWNRRVQKLPDVARRETIRRQLVAYLAASRESERERAKNPDRLERIEKGLDYLNGAAARGELIGSVAPQLNFIWSNRDGWKSLSDLRGKVVVLDFWATWCGPCVASFPNVAELTARYRGLDVEWVGVTSLQGFISGVQGKSSVDCRGDPEKEKRLLAEYIKERALDWPMVMSEESVMNADYGITGIPTLVIIAPDGVVRHKDAGLDKAQTIRRIDELLVEFRRPVPKRVD